MEHTLFLYVFILLALGSALVAFCIRFNISPILGYLTTGLLAGPHLLNWLPDSPATRGMAEVGVVLLMFTIGLEFSLPRLFAGRRLVFGLGALQIGVTTLVFAGLAIWMGLPAQAAFVVGTALAMSSTAIALKQLGEQMELATSHGQAAIAILLAQDLAAVPLLAIVPAVAEPTGSLLMAVAWPLIKAVLLFAVLMTLGKRLLHPLLHWVADTRSLEMFMLAALLLVMSTAAIAYLAGLSPALGAFLAGMLLGETEFRHQMEADIRPFRDLMLGLFFATIGMQLDPSVLWQAPHWVVLILLGLLILKSGLIMLLSRLFGLSTHAGWRTGISLSEAGEFGLLLLSLGLGLGLLPGQPAHILFAVMILSMALAPLLVRSNGAIATRLAPERASDAIPLAAISSMGDEFSDHVIICGYGRLGQNLATVLQAQGIDCLALDLDIGRVKQAIDAGEPVAFGDATNPGVLMAAGLQRARAVAVTFDDPEKAVGMTRQIRMIREELPILLRCRDAHYEEAMRAAGADVFPEGLETSLTFAAQLLVLIDLPLSEIDALLNEIRADDYAPLRVFFHDTYEDKAANDYKEQRRSIVIGDHHPAIGSTPMELGLSGDAPMLEWIMRGGVRLPAKHMDTRLRPGDILVIRGTPETLDAAIDRLRHPHYSSDGGNQGER